MNTINKYQTCYTPTFKAYERTFVMLKPDAFKRDLSETIMSILLEDKSLTLTRMWQGEAERQKLEKIWESKNNKPFFKSWMDYLSTGKVRGMVIEGDDAISKILKIKKRIRDRFAPNEKRTNLVHSSDDIPNAHKEIGIFFDNIV